MDPLPRSVVSLLHGEVRPTCSANGQKVAIIGTLTLYEIKYRLIILVKYSHQHALSCSHSLTVCSPLPLLFSTPPGPMHPNSNRLGN